MADTRRRIVEAAVGLHTSVGPASTSVAAIAERAGVQRHTVYAHFPDQNSLFRECSAHWGALHPFPDTDAVAAVTDPVERLRAGLGALYAWYEEVEDALAVLARDVSAIPDEIRAAEAAQPRALRAVVERGWPKRRTVRAAIGHALQFDTWRSLCRHEGLSRAAAVDAMVRLATSA